MATLTERMLGAALLERTTYEEVERDRTATAQALGVVVLSSVAAGIGLGAGLRGLIINTVASIVLWAIWAALVYAIGTRLLPEQDTHADWGEVARTVGFAQAPGLLRVFGIVPVLGHFVRAATHVWVLIATVVAARQALHHPLLPRPLRWARHRPVPGVRARRAERRVLVRPLPRLVLRALLLPEELRRAGIQVAAARRRYRAGAGGDRPPHGRSHARSPVAARRATRERARGPGRRLVLLAGAHRPGARARGGLGPDAGAALDQEAQDHRPPHRRENFPQPRPRLLADGEAGARGVSLA